MSVPRHQDLPECPECGCPSVPSEKAMRGDERPAGKLGCLGCGITWAGTAEQLAKAGRAEAAWERHQEKEEKTAAAERKSELDRRKWERLVRGGW